MATELRPLVPAPASPLGARRRPDVPGDALGAWRPAPPAEADDGAAPAVAVLVPALDERENLERLYRALAEVFGRHGIDGEVVLVDDGSSDGTYEGACLEAARAGVRGRVLRHGVNRGKTQALLTAAAATRAPRLVLFDADLQYAAEEIPRLVARLDEGWDIVAGRRVGHYDKRVVSRVYNALSGWLFGVPAHDLNGVKAVRREVLADVTLRHDWHRYLVVLAHARGYAVTELDVALAARLAGRSKYAGPGRILVGAVDLVVVWFYLRFSAKPMQLFGGAGLALGGAGVALGLGAVAFRALHVAPPPFGYRPVLELVVLLVLLGVALAGFGLVAEMIAILRGEVDALRRERGDADARGDGCGGRRR